MTLSGCGTALVTPFHSDGSLDEETLSKLVQWQIKSGIQFLVACGTTAETPTLNHEEWLRVIGIVAGTAAGRVPVLAGCTYNSTQDAVARAKEAAAVPGVYGLLTANPYYNKPGQEGQYRHFRAIADAVGCPVVLYNIPGRTGTNLEPSTIFRLVQDAPNIEGVKESSGNLQQIAELIYLMPPDFTVLAGDDLMTLPVIALGGAGVVSVASNEIPAEMVRMANAALDNDWTTARSLSRRYFRLLTANFWEASPGPVKCVMAMMGRLKENYRLPMVPVTPVTQARLFALAEELGLLANQSSYPGRTGPSV
jgi:4-hydroxy-tetrahydrodipicolinate synthase